MIHHVRKQRKRSRSPKPQNPTGPSIRMDTRTLYLAFLSARHIHFAAAFCIFLASSLALITLSAVFVTITTTKASVLLLPLVCQLVVWFCVFRPKVVAVAPSKEMRFRLVDRSPSYPSGSPRKKKIFRTGAEIAVEFASVYVAHTGYLDVRGNPISGLYAGRKILKGYVALFFNRL